MPQSDKILIKAKITTFCAVIKRSTKFFCTEGKDLTALPVHGVVHANAVTHGIGGFGHQQMTGNNKGMPESDP